MFSKKDPGLFEVSTPMPIQENKIPVQDKQNIFLNEQIQSPNITKKQKDFIISKNKSFFIELGRLYTKNILLRTRLNELLNIKKELNQKIIKQENQRQKIPKINTGNNEENTDNNMNNSNTNIINYYRKKKRIRRKKKEITYVYNCNISNCKKSYPTKGSLKMHIKLKHKNELKFHFNGMDKKIY